MHLFVVLAVAQIAADSVPPPSGFVNDFAGVIDSAAIARMEATIGRVRALTRGDIAVVTLRGLGGREASDVALRIGRQWRVGGTGAAGDPANNLGVVVLVVPRRNHEPGTGAVYIATGRGAEGFLPDARVGRIRDAMLPALGREDYGAALETGVGLIAQAIADAFGVSLGIPAPAAPLPPDPVRQPSRVPAVLVVVVVLVMLLIVFSQSRRGRRRRLGGWWWTGGGWGSSGFGGWGRGGGFSGGFGGFGGFGGGGGFSGGGAGGKF